MIDGGTPIGEPSPRMPEEQSSLLQRLVSYAPHAAASFTKPEIAGLVEAQLSATLSATAAHGGEPFLTYRPVDGEIHLTIAMRDCRFIIRTLEAACRQAGIEPQILAAKVTENGEQDPPSVAHLVFDEIPEQQVESFCASLDQSLRVLQRVTDDFVDMRRGVGELAKNINAAPDLYRTTRYEPPDVADFLNWLSRSDGANFVYLGHSRLTLEPNGDLIPDPAVQQGIFREHPQGFEDIRQAVNIDAGFMINRSQSIWLSKLTQSSSVIKEDRMMNVSVAERDADGQVVAVHSFVGMLSDGGKNTPGTQIPLVQHKYSRLLQAVHAEDNDHYRDFIRKMLDRMPKDAALRLGVNSLKQIFETSVGFQGSAETRVAIVPDVAERGAYAFVALPLNRVGEGTLGALKRYFEDKFGAPKGSGELEIDTSPFPHARAYIYIPSDGKLNFDQQEIERDVVELVRSWEQRVMQGLLDTRDVHTVADRAGYAAFISSTPPNYRGQEPVSQAVLDYARLKELTEGRPVKVALDCTDESCALNPTISIYSAAGKVGVTSAAKIFGSLGFTVDEQRSYKLDTADGSEVFVERFAVSPKSGVKLSVAAFEKTVAAGLEEIFCGRGDVDPLNSLMVSADLNKRGVELVRNLSAYLFQSGAFASLGSIHEALAANPKAVKVLHDMFAVRHDGGLEFDATSRESEFKKLHGEFIDLIRQVRDPVEDQTLMYLSRLVEASVRTNFYAPDANGVIATKFSTRDLDFIPQPRPLVEVFVSSDDMYGVHIRHSLVSRGGIRWSSREDLRSEVASLAATQNDKNCFIVPAGAKGGFVLRDAPEGEAAFKAAGVAAYRQFISALLSITDNIEITEEGGQKTQTIKHPPGLLIYDGNDPYLVVAADKGTAKFSDVANAISLERGFWLGDAFASGGSNGYDHKELGITAKGAWECTKRHFRDLGLTPEQPKTAVGIGDMSGDVFSNGVALFPEENVSLIAAFDHRHVAIFPKGADREKLAELAAKPGSSWADYAGELESQGGGVFSRRAKEIALTPEIRKLLDIPEHEVRLSGEQLIQFVLKAECNLLFNGGIGTYVKAGEQSDAEVDDSQNKRVRVEGSDVRAQVVTEGGNNGFTQAARNEYAKYGGSDGNGGRINTDAIDNSAGVGLSDLEVNYKILLNLAVRDGVLKQEDRDALLRSMTPQAIEADLQHNRAHAALLSLAEKESKQYLGYYEILVRELERQGLVNREVSRLPDSEEFGRRRNARNEEERGLSRPELSACLAGAKRWLKRELLASNLPETDAAAPYLSEYFPPELRDRFQEQIDRHPLRREIAATQIANRLVDTLGIHFLHKLISEYHLQPRQVEACIGVAMASERIVGAEQLLERIDAAPGLSAAEKDELSFVDRRGFRHLTGWLVSLHREDSKGPDDLLRMYGRPMDEALHNPKLFLSPLSCDQLGIRTGRLTDQGLTPRDAALLNSLPEVVAAGEIHRIAVRSRGLDVEACAAIYHAVLSTTQVPYLRNAWEQIPHGDPSDNAVYTESLTGIRKAASSIARSICGMVQKPEEADAGRREEPLYAGVRRLREQLSYLKAGDEAAARSWIGIEHAVRDIVGSEPSFSTLSDQIDRLPPRPGVNDIFAIAREFEGLARVFWRSREPDLRS